MRTIVCLFGLAMLIAAAPAAAQCDCYGPGGYAWGGELPFTYRGYGYSYGEYAPPMVSVTPSIEGVPYIDNYGVGPYVEQEPVFIGGRLRYRRQVYRIW